MAIFHKFAIKAGYNCKDISIYAKGLTFESRNCLRSKVLAKIAEKRIARINPFRNMRIFTENWKFHFIHRYDASLYNNKNVIKRKLSKWLRAVCPDDSNIDLVYGFKGNMAINSLFHRSLKNVAKLNT